MVDIAIEKLAFKYDTSTSAATTNIRQQNQLRQKEAYSYQWFFMVSFTEFLIVPAIPYFNCSYCHYS